MAAIKPIVEFRPVGGAWLECTEDVHRRVGIQTSGVGLPGPGPNDRVAGTNVCQLAMLNTAGNSGGVQGYYSPGHASQRANFAVGSELRVSIAVDADGWVDADWSATWTETAATVEPIFTGRIAKIEPEPGQHVAVVSHVEARDFMDELARDRFATVDIEQGINETQAIEIIHDNVNVTPIESLEAGAGPDTLAYVFDLTRDEQTSPVTEIARVCQSVYGSYYIQGNGAPKYKPRNEARAVADATLPTVIDLDNDDLRVESPPVIEDNRPDRIDRVFTVITPREVDPDTDEVVFSLKEAIPFPPGVITLFSGLYTDPDEDSIRIGAVDLAALVSGTDYSFNTEPDGTGTNETSNVTVTASFYGNAVNFQVDTTAVAVTVYPVSPSSPGPSVVLLQAQGVPIRSKDPLTYEAGTGSNALTINLPYQSEPDVAQALADWFQDTLSDDELTIRSVPLRLDKNDSSRSIAILQLATSDVVSVAETVTGMDGTQKFFVQRKPWAIEGDGSVWCNLELSPADAGFEVEFSVDHLTTSGSTKTGTSYTTSTITPSADQLILAWVSSKRSDSTTPGAPSVSGCGLTWTQEATLAFDVSGADRRRLTLFRAYGAAPTSGKLTINNFGGTSETQDRCSWTVGEFPTTGTSSATAVVQSVAGAAGSADVATYTVTLAAFANAANRPACGWALNADDTMAPEAAWSTIGYRSSRTSMLSATDADNADTTCVATIPHASGAVGGIAVEIKKD